MIHRVAQSQRRRRPSTSTSSFLPQLPNLSEHQIQASLIAWCRLNPLKLPHLDLIYAIPNGGLRNIKTAIKLKREGVLQGIPDLHLPVPRKPYHSLYLETKTIKTYPSKEQKEISEKLLQLGHQYHIYRCLDDAIEFIEQYYNR